MTLAHPAAVLPLRRFFPFSALVTGSLTPDFEFPLRLLGLPRFSHSLVGLVVFCLPVGLFALWLFHTWLKRPLMGLLPPGVRQRVGAPALDFAFGPGPRLRELVCGIGVGALTHIVWDSFTHEHSWIAERWPLLRAPLVQVEQFHLSLYWVLQYATTLLGLLVLVAWLQRWYRQASLSPSEPLPRSLSEPVRHTIVAGILLLSLGLAALCSLSQKRSLLAWLRVETFLVETTGLTLLFALVLLLLYSALTHRLFYGTRGDQAN